MDIEENQSKPVPKWIPSIESNIEKLFTDFFINNLQGNTRQTTLTLFTALWSKANESQKSKLLSLIQKYSQNMLSYGRSSELFFNLLTQILKSEKQSTNFNENFSEIFKNIIQSAMEANVKINQHKDNILYLFLENIVEDQLQFKPQYFELNGCLKCYGSFTGKFKNEKINYNSQDYRGREAGMLGSNQEIRGNQNKLIIRLSKTMEINQVTLRLSEFTTKRKYMQYFKSINIYINNSQNQDLQQLKNDMTLWKKIKSASLEKLQENVREVPVKFTLPVTTKFILIEVIQAQKTTFPNCQRCQAVNNEGVGIFCNTCAFSPFFDVDQTVLSSRLALDSDSILIDSDKQKEMCEKNIQDFISKIQQYWQALLTEKQNMKILYDRYNGIKCQNSSIIQLDNKNLEIQYEELMTNLNALLANKRALSQYEEFHTFTYQENIYPTICNFFSPQKKKQIAFICYKIQKFFTYTIQKDLPFEFGSTQDCYGCMQSYLQNFLQFFNTQEVISRYVSQQSYDNFNEFQEELSKLVDGNLNNKIKIQIYKTQALLDINNFQQKNQERIKQKLAKLENYLDNLSEDKEKLDQIIKIINYFKELCLFCRIISQENDLESMNKENNQNYKNLSTEVMKIIFKNLEKVIEKSKNSPKISNLILVSLLDICDIYFLKFGSFFVFK